MEVIEKTLLFDWRALISERLRFVGLINEANRWDNCHKDGKLYQCPSCDFEQLLPYRCELRICSQCASRHKLRFYEHYRRLAWLIKLRGGNRFRFLTLTLKYDKDRPLMDLSYRINLILKAARKFFYQVYGSAAWIKMRSDQLIKSGIKMRVARAQARAESVHVCWPGALGCLEINTLTGYVHLHMLIYGRWVPIDKMKDVWQRLTADRGVYIKTVHGNIDRAIADIVKYISKVPVQRSPVMTVAILKALKGRRRVFALGSFYRVLGSLGSLIKDRFLRQCPKCGSFLKVQITANGWLDWRFSYDQRHPGKCFDTS
mgnify:CR=1 FL=1